MVPKILFEDELILVVSKPAGMVVNNSNTTRHMETLEDWLEKSSYGKQVDRHGIVHRIDKPTSGVLMVAKTTAVMKFLQKQFKDRKVSKTYLALAHGEIKPSKGVIQAPISRNPFNKKRFGVFVGGRESETSYKVIKMYQSKDQVYSLVEASPKTGRTHQIRVHLKHINHSLVADEFYAGRKTARKDLKWCPRLFLHAATIEIRHPKTKKMMKFEAELSKDLKLVLEKLEL